MPTSIPPHAYSAYEFMSPVIAHRGASGDAPENTEAALMLASRQGARWAEVDVAISADGIAVIHHDHDLERCSNGTGLIILKRLAELKRYDCGSWFDPRYADQTLLTLTDLLALSNQCELALNLEVKPICGREPETVWAISQALQSVPFEQPLLLSSFNIHALRACRELLPHVTRALNVEAIPRNWQERLEEADCQGLHFAKEFADPQQIRNIRKAGYHLMTFTVNDPDTAQLLLNAGISGVFTDYPGRMIEALKQNKPLSISH